jgi:hypothetical protein
MGSGGWLNWSWLDLFQDDGSKLVALAVVCFFSVVAYAIKPLSRVWLEDRADQRKYEERMERLRGQLQNARARLNKGKVP